MIPTFIVEEHHEAFITWHYAVRKNWIPRLGNSLFHVDEHSDFLPPSTNSSLLFSFDATLEEVKEITYGELSIASFIAPACYRGLFDETWWIKQEHKNPSEEVNKMYIRSFNQKGKKLIMGKSTARIESVQDPDCRFFDYYRITDHQIPRRENVVLDIDLDYFSCSGDPNARKAICIEITPEEYRTFVDNRYHRLHYIGLKNIRAVEEDGRFYYVLNQLHQLYPCKERVDRETIDRRIERFCGNLIKKGIVPRMVGICRSRHSGYTPPDQWEYIEKNLLERMNGWYDLRIIDWSR